MNKEKMTTAAALESIMGGSSRKNTFTCMGLEFTLRYPTIMDEIRIGAESSLLLGGVKPSQVEDFIAVEAQIMATFKVCCEKAPEGFDWDKVSNDLFILELHSQYMNWVSFFRSGPEAVSTDEENSREPRSEAALGDNEAIPNAD